MACLLAGMAAYAQTTTDAESDFKPQAKKVSAELNVNPFNGNLNLNNSLNQVKLRYFIKPQLALRLGFNINRRDTVTNISNPYGANGYFFKDDRKSTGFGINLGVEKHFKGTKRLSPYVAIEAAIANKSSKETTNNNGSTISVKNGWLDYATLFNGNTYYTTTQVQQGAYFRYGANLAAGFDFYMAKHLFFGYEFNLGISKTKWKDVELTATGQPNSLITGYNGSGDNSSLNFGTTLLNGIRIGYTF